MLSLPILPRGVENKSLCTECGGRCCQRYAGIAWPADLGDSREAILAELIERFRSGLWAVDRWEGDPREYRPDQEYISSVMFVRPKHTNALDRIRDWSWGGTCVLWSKESGCSLPLEKRPTQCRAMEPVRNELGNPGGCDTPRGYSKQDAAIAWIEYQDIVQQALDMVQPGGRGTR